MLQIHAVRSILFDDVAGIRADPEAAEDLSGALRKARRRSVVVAIVDLAAILALFLLRDSRVEFLAAGASEQGLFTLGVVAVAIHAGFRLGQQEKYRAVASAINELPTETADRQPPPTR